MSRKCEARGVPRKSKCASIIGRFIIFKKNTGCGDEKEEHCKRKDGI